MHDRRIDGRTHVFGNAGALFMRAMTWYDHETRSIWSQPWGRAIAGAYKGIQLNLLASQVTTWESWKAAHPQTLVMINDVDRVRSRQGFDPDFVIGLILGGEARAYYFEDVIRAGAINDHLGDVPVVVWASANEYRAYVRQVEDRTLTFELQGSTLTDKETGSTWEPRRGIALSGPLKDVVLLSVPNTTAFDWAWLDFYPESGIYDS